MCVVGDANGSVMTRGGDDDVVMDVNDAWGEDGWADTNVVWDESIVASGCVCGCDCVCVCACNCVCICTCSCDCSCDCDCVCACVCVCVCACIALCRSLHALIFSSCSLAYTLLHQHATTNRTTPRASLSSVHVERRRSVAQS